METTQEAAAMVPVRVDGGLGRAAAVETGRGGQTLGID